MKDQNLQQPTPENGSRRLPKQGKGKKLLCLIPGVQPGETLEQFKKRVIDTFDKNGVFQIIQRRN